MNKRIFIIFLCIFNLAIYIEIKIHVQPMTNDCSFSFMNAWMVYYLAPSISTLLIFPKQT